MKSPDAELEQAFFYKTYANSKWFRKCEIGTDDTGPHMEVYVDVPAMKADGTQQLKGTGAFKVCVYNVAK